jgi:hypothetical protein
MVWAKATQSLATLEAAHIAANEKITHVNGILANLPPNPEIKHDISAGELSALKGAYKKLHSGLTTIKGTAEDELKFAFPNSTPISPIAFSIYFVEQSLTRWKMSQCS